MITDMNHFTVLADDLAHTVRFYTELLGLTPGPRPDLGFPGVWLYTGQRAVLHVIGGRALPDQPAGVLDHMAFSAQDLSQTVSKLRELEVDYKLGRQPETQLWQLFFRDPNGAKVELVFAASETA
jgi:catechol 2,3-dioxygenase-like lactoylglutathione lyase family enzyme